MTAAATAGASEPVVHSYLWLVTLAAEAVVVAWMDQLLWLPLVRDRLVGVALEVALTSLRQRRGVQRDHLRALAVGVAVPFQISPFLSQQ
jgi:hypothetical protein